MAGLAVPPGGVLGRPPGGGHASGGAEPGCWAPNVTGGGGCPVGLSARGGGRALALNKPREAQPALARLPEQPVSWPLLSRVRPAPPAMGTPARGPPAPRAAPAAPLPGAPSRPRLTGRARPPVSRSPPLPQGAWHRAGAARGATGTPRGCGKAPAPSGGHPRPPFSQPQANDGRFPRRCSPATRSSALSPGIQDSKRPVPPRDSPPGSAGGEQRVDGAFRGPAPAEHKCICQR